MKKPTPAIKNGANRFRAVPASEIKPVPIRWLWQDRIPLGKLVLLVGEEGIGKGTLLAWLAGRGTQGALEGDCRRPVNFLWISDEDSPADTIKPRLMAAQADCERVKFLQARKQDDWFTIADEAELEDLVSRHRIDAILIDPLSDYLPEGTDEWKQREMRRALQPLRQLADDLAVAVIAVVHMNKRPETSFRNRISGSHALLAFARSALLLSKDPTEDADPDSRVLTVQKANLAGRTTPVRFQIVGKRVKLPGNLGTVEQPCAVGFEDADDIAPDDVLSAAGATSGGTTKQQLAERLIAAVLRDGAPHPVREVEALCEGISKSTIKRAATELGVEHEHDNAVPPNHLWRLAPSRVKPDEPTGREPTGRTGGNGAVKPRSARRALQSAHHERREPTGPKREARNQQDKRRSPWRER